MSCGPTYREKISAARTSIFAPVSTNSGTSLRRRVWRALLIHQQVPPESCQCLAGSWLVDGAFGSKLCRKPPLRACLPDEQRGADNDHDRGRQDERQPHT